LTKSTTKALVSSLLCLVCLSTAHAQTPPSKTIRLIVPYAAGGPIDVTARVLAERVKDSLGTVIIENRPGAGGNIGGSLLNCLDEVKRDDFVVLELSSAMLYWLGETLRWSPRVAVLTNLLANHIDWHGSFEHYAHSKSLLRAFAPADARFVTAFDGSPAAERAIALGADAAFAGKAFLWSLGALGDRGPEHYIRLLVDELRASMGQLGCSEVSQLRSLDRKHPGAWPSSSLRG
jgi:hypothetical protein